MAYLSGLSVLLQQHKYYRLKMKIDGKKYPIESPMIFFGNNQLQLQELKLNLASCAASGKLAAVALGKVSQWQLLKLIIRLFQGNVENAKNVYPICADHVEISTSKKSMKVALDGEIIRLATPLYFQVLHDAVQVRVPHAAASV